MPKEKRDNLRMIFYLDKNSDPKIVRDLFKKLDTSFFKRFYRGVIYKNQIELIEINSIQEILK